MGKKKTGATPTNVPRKEKKLVINMTKAELAKAYEVPSFKTGKYISEKDRPRKKSWKSEYERTKRESGRNNTSGSFLLQSRKSFINPVQPLCILTNIVYNHHKIAITSKEEFYENIT